MFRHLIFTVLTAAFLTSCGNKTGKDVSVNSETKPECMKVEFSALAENPDNYIDTDIVVEGKVVHVCTHSGKKLFIVGDNPDIRLFISAGEEMPRFSMDLLGSEVVVEGHITRLASSAPAGGMHEGEVKKTSENCETEAAVAAQSALADIVMEYKKHSVK